MNYAIIGAGPAGIEAASTLAALGHQVALFERHSSPLKNIADKAFLFPNFADALDLVKALDRKLQHPNIHMQPECDILDLQRSGQEWKLTDQHGQNHFADRVLVATGYTPFDARRKEELGYGIYKGVHTSLELERMLRHRDIRNSIGERPKSVSFLQCVGSRDEKSGNHYCSKVCCVTAVKQAIEVKRLLPETEVFVFYMDLRMWGQGFEEMYREAQEQYGVHFVRGRISEAAATFDGRVQIKAEDTLMGLPVRMTTDLLFLMVGMEPSEGTRRLGQACGLCGKYGFFQTLEPHLDDTLTSISGLFAAGTCKRPMSINDTLNDARAAALAMINQENK